MIDKIVKYVQDKLPVTITESLSTNSKYIRFTEGGKQVRVSDHFGNIKDNVDVTIVIPENPGQFIVVMGFKTFIYNSFQKVAEFIVIYLIPYYIYQKPTLRLIVYLRCSGYEGAFEALVSGSPHLYGVSVKRL